MERSRKNRDREEVDSRKDEHRGSPNRGVLAFVEGSEICADIATECPNCGTLCEFLVDRCPICGKRFDIASTGLVSMFSDMDFDTDHAAEIACPVCGETVKPKRGKCPECNEPISFTSPHDPGVKVDPIVHDDNVVFVHLDVESGEVNCLQRAENASGFEHLSVHVETVGQGEFDRDRKGVWRM